MNDDNDNAQIRALIATHFDGMKWSRDMQPDWELFSADFLPGAQLFPAARPVQPKQVDEFIDRMNTVAREKLHSFEEHTSAMTINRFGNIAVVMAGSRMLENKAEENFDVSGYLLVKSEGRWSIAAHAWDQATQANPVPAQLR
jgi:hypothetical protein